MKWPPSSAIACLVSSVGVTAGCGDPPNGGGRFNGEATDASSRDATSPVDTRTPLDELPPIDVASPNALVINLSASEEIALCDWTAQELGGYGSGGLPCPDDAASAGIGAPSGLGDCVSTYQISRWGPDCPLTVQDFMDCWTWLIQNVCNTPDLSLLPPSCKTQLGPLCEGGIYADVRRPAMADAEAGSVEAGDDTSEAAPDVVDAAIDDADGSPD
jgi:hypothetical protein